MKHYLKLIDRRIICSAAGLLALLGLFLPYTQACSFYHSISGPEWGPAAPAAVLLIALASVLYALGLSAAPQLLGLTLLLLYLFFLGSAMWLAGPWTVLVQLRAGAWLTLLGLGVLALGSAIPAGRRTFPVDIFRTR